jgi:hypothetical protein
MAGYIPPGTNIEAWGERSRLCGEYLPRIATSQGVERQKLICELVVMLFDSWADRRVTLVKTLGDISPFDTDQALTLSLIVMPHLSEVRLDEQESDAINLTVCRPKAVRSP